MNTKSHTIRFEEKQKEKIVKLGELNGRRFQTQVSYMLDQQLKLESVNLLLGELENFLYSLEENQRDELIEEIRTTYLKPE